MGASVPAFRGRQDREVPLDEPLRCGGSGPDARRFLRRLAAGFQPGGVEQRRLLVLQCAALQFQVGLAEL